MRPRKDQFNLVWIKFLTYKMISASYGRKKNVKITNRLKFINWIKLNDSKLPHSLNSSDNELQICLIVKDVDPKDRDYEKTIRKYNQIIEQANLSSIITRVTSQI